MEDSRVFQSITAATVSDCVALYVTTFNAPPWNDGWTHAAAHERLSHFANFPHFEGLGLWVNNCLLGFALGWAERWVSNWQFHLYEMCIATHAQRQGHGRALLTALEQRITEKGQTAVFLQTAAAAPARKFYEACGYRDRGLIILGKSCVR